MKTFALAIHGGAGTILRQEMSAEMETSYLEGMALALEGGERVLEGGGSALDAVTAAVSLLEDCPLFNAGRGSVYNAAGRQEMDAAIMEGRTRQAGAVAGISGIRHPVQLARDIMEHSGHVFLIGEGAMNYAEKRGWEKMPEEWFYDEFRYAQWKAIRDTDDFQLDHFHPDRKFGTVGAVALDLHGDLAAATSTGGMTNKRYGRVGDTPLIGSGNFAWNKTCAVSCTGSGEFFIRGVVAYDVSCLIEYKGLSLEAACEEVIFRRLPEIGGDGGLIAVDVHGHIALPFNTEGMYRGFVKQGEEKQLLIYR